MSEQAIFRYFQSSNGIKVGYKHKVGKYDYNHILFVFSGFGRDRPDHYNFTNVLDYYPAHVIWVNDNFEDFFTYYMCINLDFKIADAVGEFIKIKTEELNIPWQNITLLGGSKGGSAALYHGLRWNIKNIVACVPQIKIGTFLDDEKPFTEKTARHMMGEYYSQFQIHRLDKVIVELLKKDTELEKNIYLLTSEYDDQYKKYLSDYLDDFKRYSNFNLMKTYSAFVTHHAQITEHHLSLVLGILYCLVSEGVPTFPNKEINFFGSQPVGIKPPTFEPYLDLHQLEYKNDRFFIQGVGLPRGVACPTYNDIHYALLLKSELENVIEKELAKTHNDSLSRRLFDGELVNYDKCTFTTIKYAGLDISDIPQGVYRLSLKIQTNIKTSEVVISSTKIFSQETDELKIYSDQNGALLHVK